jgi:hypothetical protein
MINFFDVFALTMIVLLSISDLLLLCLLGYDLCKALRSKPRNITDMLARSVVFIVAVYIFFMLLMVVVSTIGGIK